MTRNQRRRDRIRSEIPIAQLLSDLGYAVRPDAAHREQQFSCDLHGDGRDSKPSARVYPDNNAWYCFGCPKHRDAIRTVRDKFGLSFVDALKWLEEKYGLPNMSFEDTDDHGPSFNQNLAAEIDPVKTYEDDRTKISVLLSNITVDRILDLETIAAFWEALDRLTYMVAKEQIEELPARKAILKLRERVLEEWKVALEG